MHGCLLRTTSRLTFPLNHFQHFVEVLELTNLVHSVSPFPSLPKCFRISSMTEGLSLMFLYLSELSVAQIFSLDVVLDCDITFICIFLNSLIYTPFHSHK